MLRRFISYYRPYKGLFALDMGTAILRAGLLLGIPYVLAILLKEHLPAGDLEGIVRDLVIIGVLVSVESVAIYVNTRWGHILGTRMEADMRADLFGHLQKLSYTYYDNTKTGHLISRIANDLFNVTELAHHGPEDFILSVIMLVGGFLMMFHVSPPLAVVALTPIPLMAGWALFFGVRLRRGWRQIRQRIADINSTVENSIQGIREVKSFANEDYEIERFEGVNAEFRGAKEGMYKSMAGFHGGMMFFMESYQLIIIGGGVLLAHAGRIELADVVVFLAMARLVMRPIRRLTGFVEQFQQGIAAFERFVEVLDVEPDIVDRPGALRPEKIRGEVALENVWFKYLTSDDWVLKDFNLRIDPGRTVALVGESGAGKSTVARLIPRFYEVQRGRVTVDDCDVLDLQQRFLRERIGIVQQNVFLFDATIRENIVFGRPGAAEDELRDAARHANILDFIESLPDGFDALVGEHGVKLSGGQKQRVSIARVFLKNPPILIFDEATSSLDTESERLIKESMDELCRDRTTLVIAHRLSTVRNADRTYVIRNGEVVEQGRHDDLIARDGYYTELYAGSAT